MVGIFAGAEAVVKLLCLTIGWLIGDSIIAIVKNCLNSK
jgi:hypothetical protein